MPGSSSKGNPASHRMSNTALKTRRAASWARGKARKAALAKATPKPAKKTWEQREAERAQRRAGLGLGAGTNTGTPSRYTQAVWNGAPGVDMHTAGIRAGTVADRRR